MSNLKQVSLISRIKPDRNGTNKIIDSIKLKNKQYLEISFPENSNQYKPTNQKGTYYSGSVVKPKVSQVEFYDSFGDDIINNLFSSQNALFLSYGITGSGKSFTTVGTTLNEGLLHRACKQLLNSIQQKSNSHIQYCVKLSVIGVYTESSIDLIGTHAIPKGSYAGSQLPVFTEKEITSLSSFINVLLQCEKNLGEYATSHQQSISYYHTIYSLFLIQRKHNQTTPLSVIRFVDLAGCEDSKSFQYGRLIRSPSCSIRAIQQLLECIQQAISHSSFSTPSTLLTALLQDHFTGNPTYIAIIHCISNKSEDLVDTIDALERLKPLASLLESLPPSQAPTAVIPLCKSCIQYKEQIEECIRDKVISEIFSRKRTHPSTTVSPTHHHPIQQYLNTLQSDYGDAEVDEIIAAYDQENRELLMELADTKRRNQELTDKLDDKNAQITQLNHIISLLQKSQTCGNGKASLPSTPPPPQSPPKSMPNRPPQLIAAQSPRLPTTQSPRLPTMQSSSPPRSPRSLTNNRPPQLITSQSPPQSPTTKCPPRLITVQSSPRLPPIRSPPRLNTPRSPSRSPTPSSPPLPAQKIPNSPTKSSIAKSTPSLPQPCQAGVSPRHVSQPGYQLDTLYPTNNGTSRYSNLTKSSIVSTIKNPSAVLPMPTNQSPPSEILRASSQSNTTQKLPPLLHRPSNLPQRVRSTSSPRQNVLQSAQRNPLPSSVPTSPLMSSHFKPSSTVYVIDEVNMESMQDPPPFDLKLYSQQRTGTVKSPEKTYERVSEDFGDIIDNISIDMDV